MDPQWINYRVCVIALCLEDLHSFPEIKVQSQILVHGKKGSTNGEETLFRRLDHLQISQIKIDLNKHSFNPRTLSL